MSRPAAFHSGPEPRVSIILPTYNRAPLLARSIASVLRQSYDNFELLVIDDGSTDETLNVVAGFTDPRIKYFSLARNVGASAARNAGISLAQGQFLAFQDSDDEWFEAKLAKQMSAFRGGPTNLGMVYSDMERILADGTATYFAAPGIVPGRLIDPATQFYQVHNLGIQSAVIKREYLERAGSFSESLPVYEDLELFIRLSRLCDFQHLQEPLVKYYDTRGISQDLHNRWISRRAMLRRYYKELLTRDPVFLLKEVRWLCIFRHEALKTCRARSH
jgi:glycosyltransferase involved in cell wall biosynthesis